jgi:hypothetical protein
MAERPIILFGKPSPMERAKRKPAIPNLQLPTHSRQAIRFEPMMGALKSTLATLQQSPVGIEPEKALVFELAKDIKAFYTAATHLGDGIEIIFDVPKDFDISDDFFLTKYNKLSNERSRRDDREVFGGKVYCVLTNAIALREMINLWKRYSKDPKTAFPRGKGGLKQVFNCLVDVHQWGYNERIEETGVLATWNEDLRDPDLKNVKCEIELYLPKVARCPQLWRKRFIQTNKRTWRKYSWNFGNFRHRLSRCSRGFTTRVR